MLEPPNGYHDRLSQLLSGVPIRRRCARAGQVICFRGDRSETAMVVRSGLAGLEVACGARDAMIATLYRPGDLIGVGRLLLPGSVHEGTVRALSATEVQLIDWGDLTEARAGEQLRPVLAEAAVCENRWLTERVAEAALLRSAPRVARALCRLAGTDHVVGVNQDAVAAVAGVVRATANAELGRLAALGLIERSRCRIRLIDRPAVERFASRG